MMLVVSRVSMKSFGPSGIGTGPFRSVPFYYLNDGDWVIDVEVKLTDYDTGREVEFVGKPAIISKKLLQYKPYGWVQGGYEKGDGMLIEIDKLTYASLDYIDDIAPVHIKDDGLKFLHQQRSIRGMWGSSILGFVDYSTSFCQQALPLLATICHFPGWFHDDKYYIRGMNLNAWCVSFVDFDKARGFFSKVAMSGYDPVGKHEVIRY